MKQWPWTIKLLLCTFFFEGANFLASMSLSARVNSDAQMWQLLFIPILCVLCLIVFVALFSPKNKPYRLMLTGALLLFPISYIAAAYLGSFMGDWLFYRDLPRMKQVVALVQKGSIPIYYGITSYGEIPLPAQYQDLAAKVRGERDSKGRLMVTFFVGGAFPSKHQCYIYNSNDNRAAVEKGWPSGFRREKQWFEVRD